MAIRNATRLRPGPLNRYATNMEVLVNYENFLNWAQNSCAGLMVVAGAMAWPQFRRSPLTGPPAPSAIYGLIALGMFLLVSILKTPVSRNADGALVMGSEAIAGLGVFVVLVCLGKHYRRLWREITPGLKE